MNLIPEEVPNLHPEYALSVLQITTAKSFKDGIMLK
jgi:hypothetical protein